MSQEIKNPQAPSQWSDEIRTAKHISASYSRLEDRLHFGFTMADGSPLGAWVTRRTADKLVSALVGEVERDPKILGTTARRGAVGAGSAAASAMRSFAQEEARIDKKQNTPKTPPPRPEYAPDGLCTHIRLVQNRGGCVLAFSLSAASVGSCKVSLNFTKIRNFIDALHTLFQSAGWPTDDFPAWVTAPPQLADTLSLN